MSKLKYLKGIRTRYVNIRQETIRHGNELIQSDISEKDLSLKIKNCTERLNVFNEKFEAQSEKVTGELTDTDEDLVERILQEDEILCNSALTLCQNLKDIDEKLTEALKQKTEAKHKISTDTELQGENRKLVQSEIKDIEERDSKLKKKNVGAKLPKLDICVFGGDRLKWIEFWQSFETSIHNNRNLSDIDKLNNLRSKLVGEAESAISGLYLSNENYEVAVKILKERFGNLQETIDMHYNEMINLKPFDDKVTNLMCLLDSLDKHLRSLEVLEQDINQDVFISIIKSKLPSNVIKHLELEKGSK